MNPSKHGTFKTDAIYCAEHGVSRIQHSRTVRKWLNYHIIGEWYDVSVSVNQNHKYAQANGIKVCLNTLKNFCIENNIDMQPNRKAIEEWYNVALSVKQNLVYAKEHGIKVSQTQLYNYCRKHNIDTKGRNSKTGGTIQGEAKES